jgi:hypothetical protein
MAARMKGQRPVVAMRCWSTQQLTAHLWRPVHMRSRWGDNTQGAMCRTTKVSRRMHGLGVRAQAAPDAASNEQAADALQCITTPDGILLCNHARPDARFMVRRLEDKPTKGDGGMEENWFLAGQTAQAYCSVDDNGTLVCNMQEPGMYVVKEVRLPLLLDLIFGRRLIAHATDVGRWGFLLLEDRGGGQHGTRVRGGDDRVHT